MREDEYRAMFDLEERMWWYDGMRGITATLLAPALAEKKDQRFVDLGCGTGYSLVWLRDRFKFAEAHGVDLSPHAAAFWRARGLDTVALATADKLPFGNTWFVLVTCLDVIYHLPDNRPSPAASTTHPIPHSGALIS